MNPEKDLAAIERLGGGFLTPSDEHWPAGLNGLPNPPLGLWYRGQFGDGIPGPGRYRGQFGDGIPGPGRCRGRDRLARRPASNDDTVKYRSSQTEANKKL
jgi:hypothetical protein